MNPKDSSIGIIGLGDMGGGIAANLVRAGFDVTGFDLKPEEMQRFAGGWWETGVQWRGDRATM